MNTFKELAAKAKQNHLKQPLRIVPNRPSVKNPVLEKIAREAGDRFYHCAKEISKIFYIKIDARFPNRITNPEQSRLHAIKFGEARNILNESRNLIFECVLPLFQITMRTNQPFGEADTHAHDYFVKNCLYSLVQTYLAWADELVLPEDVETVKKVVQNVSEVQTEKLERELQNYFFEFRPVVAPLR